MSTPVEPEDEQRDESAKQNKKDAARDAEASRQERAQPAPKNHAEAGPTFAASEPRISDLSKEIVRTIARGPGERVTCRRISGNHYRCNWWSARDTEDYDNPGMSGMMVTTHRVARSELLRVTKSSQGLSIESAATGGAR